jgi:hypothetical protein
VNGIVDNRIVGDWSRLRQYRPARQQQPRQDMILPQ